MQDPRLDKPHYWKGIFYINKSDKRLFLPKQNANMGYTLNFGNRFSYVFIFAIILFIILTSIY